jgi:uncharacterized repeat protein (TIGR02543 family)
MALITYVLNGGINNPAALTTFTSTDLPYTLLAPTKEGYTFVAWYEEETFVTPITDIAVEADITVYADWTLNSYTLTYDVNGGSAIAPELYDYDETIVQPADPTKAGLTFDGWYLDDGTFLQEYTFGTMPAGDFTIYAKWNAVLTFVSNGGSAEASQTVLEGSVIVEPSDPTRIGYTFDGWFTDDSTFLIAYDFTDPVVADTIIYAGWTPIAYNITYNNLLGIAHANPATYTVEDLPLTLLDPAVTPRYTFSYWSGVANGAIPAGTLGDISLTAVWSAIGDFIALPVYEDTTNLAYKVNKNYIVEVKAVPSDYKYRIQLTVSPGALIKLYPIYNTKAEAQAAVDAFLAMISCNDLIIDGEEI